MSVFTYKTVCIAALLLSASVHAQERLTLKQAFDMAWVRQPEARAADLRRNAVEARRDAAGNWLVAQPNVELATKTDRANRNDGSREYEVGFGLPLWLPGERSSAQALADADANALQSRQLATQLRLAANVRAAWWAAVQADIEQELAQARLKLAEQLAGDVARRVRAGDLARADQHQAEGAVANAQALVAEAQIQIAQVKQRLRSLLGVAPAMLRDSAPEVVPAALLSTNLDEAAHPALREISDRAESARRAKALAATQTRNNPQLLMATTRERGSFGDTYAQSITVGVRIPFGADNRKQAGIANAEAEAVEAEARLALEQDSVLADIEAARARVAASESQRTAAERRAVLARETRSFFDKSFRLGESDLPTRLRVELESYEAERQFAKSRIAVALSISQLRQALGLLPE